MAREAAAFSAIAVCPSCGCDFEAVWPSGALDTEDTEEAPDAELTCPACGHRWTEEYPGWSEYQSAG